MNEGWASVFHPLLPQALDLPWQPGVAVFAADGTILYKELGASSDRADKIRAANPEITGEPAAGDTVKVPKA